MKICYQFFLCNGLIFFILLLLTNNTFAQPPTENLILDCSPKNMEIKFFKDKGTGKDLKIVVGRAIEFKAKPGNLQSYQWSLGANNGVDFWPLSTGATGAILAPTTKSGIAFIQNLPANNSDFGSAHGNLVLSDPAGNVTTANKTVEVFFKKDDMHSTGVPNWFFYWKQEVIGNPTFDYLIWDSDQAKYIPHSYPISITFSNVGEFAFGGAGGATAGKTRIEAYVGNHVDVFNPANTDGVLKGFDELRIILGELSGNVKKCPRETSGIESFYSTYSHEMKHIQIFADLWPDGYFRSNDSEPDLYPDDWETTGYGHVLGFDSNRDDRGGYREGPNCSIIPLPLNTMKKGALYEENVARAIELSIAKNLYNNVDWSFDPSRKVQGKNW